MHKLSPMKTPLANARGLGSAKSGLAHWWHQRLTAMAMVGLVSWMIYIVISLSGADYTGAIALLSAPVNAAILVLFIIVGFWHAVLGLQVVIEDYISHEGIRFAAIIAIKMIFVLLAVFTLICVLKIVL